jgi:hypothetical protein
MASSSTSSSSCAPANPFVRLGDGGNAPILNYNLPQKTCYHGKAHFPLAIPANYFAAAYQALPAGNAWSQAEAMTLEQITARLRAELLGSQPPLFLLGASLLQSRNGLVRFLADEGTSYLAPDPKPQVYVQGDEHARLTPLPSSSGPKPRPRINHLQAIPTLPPDKITVAGYTLAFLAQQVADGLLPELYVDFDRKVKVRFLPRPTAFPKLTVVEHYRVCAFLGDYGAGKVLKTFSLLPGESTTISVRSYKDQTSSYTKSSSTDTNEYTSTYYAQDENSVSTLAENALEGYSTHAATQLQSHIESMNQSQTGSSTNSTSSNSSSGGGGAQAGFNLFGLFNAQVGGGFQVSGSNTTTQNGYRNDLVSNLNSAISASANESSSYRDVQVNTTSGNAQNNSSGGAGGGSASMSVSQQESMLIKSGEETSTLRVIQNINHSRTLNFVFRQMLQEYIVLTWLDDVTIQFTTGNPGQHRSVRLSQLESFLAELIPDTTQRDEVRKAILLQLCNVANYQGTIMPFAEKVSETFQDCVDGLQVPSIDYWRKRANLTDTYTSGGLDIKVPGVILSAASHILRTDSVIVDAVLGQGEALDCYNIRLQEAAATAQELQNKRFDQETAFDLDQRTLALDILRGITDPVQAAEAYRRVFGECCGTEQLMLLLNANNSTPSN